jgi:hypothetical protein
VRGHSVPAWAEHPRPTFPRQWQIWKLTDSVRSFHFLNPKQIFHSNLWW